MSVVPTEENEPIRKMTTSAGRLRQQLSIMRSASPVEGARNRTGVDVIPGSLGIAPDHNNSFTPRAVIRAIHLLGQMLDDVEAEILETRLPEEDKRFYLETLPDVANSISPMRLNEPWNEGKKLISDVVLRDLSHIDRILQREIGEKQIPKSNLTELWDEVQEAANALNSAELDEDLKDFIAQQLLRIKDAIDHYRFRGRRGLAEALAAYGGGLAMVSASAVPPKTEEGKPWIERLLRVWKRGLTVLDMAKKTHEAWPQIAAGFDHLTKLLPK